EETRSGLNAKSPNRSEYLDLRAEANHLKSVASYAISAVMFNHLVSAVDAIFTTSRWNREHATRLGGRLWYNPDNPYGLGGVQLTLAL
ncbi:MAG: hypothetical protein JSW54_06265, partial [Fidelibacterota bacterium]